MRAYDFCDKREINTNAKNEGNTTTYYFKTNTLEINLSLLENAKAIHKAFVCLQGKTKNAIKCFFKILHQDQE